MSLHIYSARYRRGHIVKLAPSNDATALIKFSIERDGQGTYKVLALDGSAKRVVADHQTEQQATGYAIRECERIRDHYAGGVSGSR